MDTTFEAGLSDFLLSDALQEHLSKSSPLGPFDEEVSLSAYQDWTTEGL